MPMSHGNTLRRGRHSEVGQIYLLTTVVYHRKPAFNDLFAARLCIQSLRQQDLGGRSETLAFVLMPDHLHWLVMLKSGSLDEVMQSVKGNSSRVLNRHLNRTGRFWQAGYHDHALRCDEDVKAVARYMIANPVRAGLVGRTWDYPHWDAIWVEECPRG